MRIIPAEVIAAAVAAHDVSVAEARFRAENPDQDPLAYLTETRRATVSGFVQSARDVIAEAGFDKYGAEFDAQVLPLLSSAPEMAEIELAEKLRSAADEFEIYAE